MNIFSLLNVKAILLGFIADFVASTLFGIVSSFLAALTLSAKGFKKTELEARLIELFYSEPYLIFGVAAGLGFTVMGGYVAGRISKSGEYFHSGAVGILNMLLGLFFIDKHSAWYNITALLLAIPAAIMGGRIAKSRNKRIIH